MKPRRKSLLRAALKLTGAGALLILGGCSSMGGPSYDWSNLSKPFFRDAKMEGPPRVENCAILAISTPSSYECNGKKYTSLELADIREGKTPPPLLSSPMPSTPRSLIQQ